MLIESVVIGLLAKVFLNFGGFERQSIDTIGNGFGNFQYAIRIVYKHILKLLQNIQPLMRRKVGGGIKRSPIRKCNSI